MILFAFIFALYNPLVDIQQQRLVECFELVTHSSGFRTIFSDTSSTSKVPCFFVSDSMRYSRSYNYIVGDLINIEQNTPNAQRDSRDSTYSQRVRLEESRGSHYTPKFNPLSTLYPVHSECRIRIDFMPLGLDTVFVHVRGPLVAQPPGVKVRQGGPYEPNVFFLFRLDRSSRAEILLESTLWLGTADAR